MRKILCLLCLTILTCSYVAFRSAQCMSPQALSPSFFNYDISLSGADTFNKEGWTYNPGDTLFFTASTPTDRISSDIVVVLASTPDDSVYNNYVYKLALGRSGGKTSLLCNCYYKVFLHDSSILIGEHLLHDSSILIGEHLLDDDDIGNIKYAPTGETSYWVKFMNGTSTTSPTFSFGTGTVAGQNVVGSWSIPANSGIPTPQYFGFGGLGCPVNFKNISVIRATTTAAVTQTSNETAFLAVVGTTPGTLNAAINAYSNTATYPTFVINLSAATKTAVNTLVSGFFNTDGTPKTGQSLADLQILLKNTSLNGYLPTVTNTSIWLTNVNTAISTPTTTPTVTPTTVSIDTMIQNAISAAMTQKGIGSQITALDSNVAKKYQTTVVSSATQTAFSTAIMNVGGTYIYNNLNKLKALYSQIYNKVKAKQKLTAADKTHIKTAITPYINRVGGNPANFQTLLTDSLKTKLLTGPVGMAGTNMFFVNTVLIPAVKILIYLSGIK